LLQVSVPLVRLASRLTTFSAGMNAALERIHRGSFISYNAGRRSVSDSIIGELFRSDALKVEKRRRAAALVTL